MAEAEKSDPLAVHFRAFVSYSHADAAIAQKLHRKIETYRLPRHLQADHLADANHGRLGRIFRDREDLPAAEDLSESVKRALAGSRVLVVICSPEARQSIWVAREIELFRELHPDRPILAAIVRGEPAEAFPAPLKDGVEPLAADLRSEGDGWRLGFLKIIAGIADVPLDALVQRDAARRIRRVMAVTGGALVALLAMIGMTIFAIQSRNEAQHQQAEAEGLVEYMLTDLRTELKGVGRLDVMTDVNERAMDYYEDQGDLSDMPAESLERRARILHAMGEDDEKRGDLDKALAKFTEAHRVTEALLAQDPDNPDRIFGHAQSEFYVGLVAWRLKDRVTATRHWRAYRTQAKHLNRVEQDTFRSLMELGYSEGNLCELNFADSYDLDRAEQQCRHAVEFETKAYHRDPSNHSTIVNLANRYGWLADVYLARKKFEHALNSRNEEAKLMDQLIKKYPANVEFALRRSWADIGRSRILRQTGNIDDAISITAENLNRVRNLYKKSKEDMRIVGTLLRALGEAAHSAKRSNDPRWLEYLSEAELIFDQNSLRGDGAVSQLSSSMREITDLKEEYNEYEAR